MKRTALNFLALIVMLLPYVAFSQQNYEVKQHSLVVEGTSNLHDWTATAENVSGNLKLKVDNGKITAINGIDVKVDATSLKASKGSIMESKIDDALKVKKNPYILFKSTGGTINDKTGAYKITTNGVLTIAGVSKNISLDAVGKVLPNGQIEFSGSKKLKMTDYKVEPPKAMLGSLTTGDEITLNYKVVVNPK